MDHRIAGEVTGAAEDVNHDVFRGQLWATHVSFASFGDRRIEQLTWVTIIAVAQRPGKAKPYETFLTMTPADPRAGEAT